jgi:GH15 family glucan-1,4-alpha-glucosidase
MPPEGAFLACSFWLVECLSGQGRIEEARAVYDRVLRTATDLGLYPEQVDPATDAPLGNFPLVLTHLSHIHAALALEAAAD